MGKAKGIRAGRAFVELGVDDRTAAGLRAVSAKMRRFGNQVGALGRSMLLVGGAALATFGAALKSFSGIGDAMAKMAKRTGFSVEALSGLAYAAELSGSSVEDLEKGIRRMQATVVDAGLGLSTALDALGFLKLGFEDLSGLSPEDQFELIAERLSKIEDPTLRAATAMKIFGRAGTKLLPMFAGGAAGMKAAIAEALRLGLIMSGEDAAAAEVFTDAMTRLWKQVKMFVFHVGAALAPELLALAGRLSEAASRTLKWISANRGLIAQKILMIAKIAAWVAGIGLALVVVGKLIGVIAGLIKVMAGLKIAMAFLWANPIVAVIGAIAVAAGILAIAIRAWGDAQEALNKRAEAALDRGDKQRSQDMDRMARLEKLAAKENLNNDQMKEAQGLAEALQGHYGNLGIKIDETAGKISLAADAQERLNHAMRAVTILQLSQEIDELKGRIGKLHAKQLEMVDGWKTAWVAPELLQDVGRDIDKLQTKMFAATTRLKALKAGEGWALTGGAKPGAKAGVKTPAELAAESAAKAMAAADRRIHQLTIGQIKDEKRRSLASINERYDHEIKATRDQAAEKMWSAEQTDAVIRRLQNARNLELADTGAKFDAKAQSEMDKRAQARFDSEKDRAAQIAELELRTKYAGVELERKLLDLAESREAIALRTAGASLQELQQLRKEYGLRRKLLGTRGAIETAAMGAWTALGGRAFAPETGMESLKQSSRETAENTRKIADGIATFMPRFT